MSKYKEQLNFVCDEIMASSNYIYVVTETYKAKTTRVLLKVENENYYKQYTMEEMRSYFEKNSSSYTRIMYRSYEFVDSLIYCARDTNKFLGINSLNNKIICFKDGLYRPDIEFNNGFKKIEHTGINTITIKYIDKNFNDWLINSPISNALIKFKNRKKNNIKSKSKYVGDTRFSSYTEGEQINILHWIIENVIPRKTFNYCEGSYQLKHHVERSIDLYVTEIAFVEAMYLLGHKGDRKYIARDTNYRLNIKKKKKARK